MAAADCGVAGGFAFSFSERTVSEEFGLRSAAVIPSARSAPMVPHDGGVLHSEHFLAAPGNQLPVLHPASTMLSSGGRDGTGEVRFDDARCARLAVKQLDGGMLLGAPLHVQLSPHSTDHAKVLVSNLNPGIEWQDLKDHFSSVGTVAFAEVRGSRRAGPPAAGEVRYATAEAARTAMLALQGSSLDGSEPLRISLDPSSKDCTKLLVSGLPSGTDWRDLKHHFASSGVPVEYAGVHAVGAMYGEVRYESAADAQVALQRLNGTELGGTRVFVQLDAYARDGSRLFVTGLSTSTGWQDLKDHFAVIGRVAFAGVHSKGMGKGGGASWWPGGGRGGGKGGKGQAMYMVPVMMPGGSPWGGGWGGKGGGGKAMVMMPAGYASYAKGM